MAIGDKNELTLKISADAKQAKAEIASLRSEVVSNVGTIISALPGGEVIGGIINQVSGLSRAVEASLALISKATASAAQAVGTVADATTTATAATEAATVATEAQTVATEASAVATETKAAASQVAATTQTELAVATTTATVAEEGATVATVELGVAATATDVALTPMVATIGALGIGLAAVAIVLTAGAVAGFKLAESAAEAGSEIHDLAQQTNLNTLSLSAMKLAAGESKGSIDGFGVAWGRAGRIAQSAVEGNKAAIATLKEFNTTGQELQANSDAALGKIISRLHELVPSGQAAAAAQKLFGRSGAELIPIVEQMNGNLAEAIQKAKDLGVAFTKEGADAADEFGDKLHDLTALATGLGYSIGNVLLPAFVELFRVVSAETKPSGGFSLFKFILADIKTHVDGAKDSLLILIAALETLPDLATAGSSPLGQAGIAGKFVGNLARIQTESTIADPSEAKKGPPLSGGGGDKKDSAETILDRRLAVIKAGEDKIRVAYEKARDDENALFEERKESLQILTAAQIVNENKRLMSLLGVSMAERRAIEESGIAEDAKAAKLADLDAKNAKATQDRDHAVAELRKHLREQEEAAEIAHKEALLRIQEETSRGQIASAKALANEGFITFEEAETRRQALEGAALHERLELLREEEEKWGENKEKKQAIHDEIDRLEKKDVADKADRLRQIDEARQKDVDREKDAIDEVNAARQRGDDQREADRIAGELRDPTSSRSLFGDDFADALDLGQSKLEAFAKASQGIFHQLSASAGNFGTMMKDVFNGMGQAVGNVVRSFALFGNAGTTFRKFATEVISSLAQMAATKAVFELAEGLAALARAFFGDPKAAAEATAHFSAAAQYGVVAGVAAIAGRVIAGNAFQDQSAGSGAGAGSPAAGSTGTTGTGSASNPTITQNRNQEQHIFLHVQSNDSHIVRVVQQDVRNNGSTRDMIVSLAGG